MGDSGVSAGDGRASDVGGQATDVPAIADRIQEVRNVLATGRDERAIEWAIGSLGDVIEMAEARAPLHLDRPWHDDWMKDVPHGDHHPTEDCLRCYTARLWSSYGALRQQNALLNEVAHRAWHLLDDGGEQEDDPGEFVAFMIDVTKVSDALDALEATGWDGCRG